MPGITKEQADLWYAAIQHGHDHGTLSGLGDDDHPQYYNQVRGDARYLQDAASNGKYYVRKDAAWVVHDDAFVGKGRLVSNVNVTWGTTLTDVSGLTFSLLNSHFYNFRGKIWYYTSAAIDCKYRFYGVVDSYLTCFLWRNHVVPGTTAKVAGADMNSPATVPIAGSVDGYGFIEFEAFISVGATGSKAFSFQIAQNTAGGNSYPIVQTGSYIEYAIY